MTPEMHPKGFGTFEKQARVFQPSCCVSSRNAYMTPSLKVVNMAASRLEINFRRLLERCETMAAELQDDKENVNWRLEKVTSKLGHGNCQ